MKKRVLSILLALTLIVAVIPFSALTSSAAFSGTLQFNQAGKFRIIQLADIQDYNNVNSRTITLITNAMVRYQPDLVVFTGDNYKGGYWESYFQTAVNQFTQPLINNNIKYAVTFGNHDDESTAPSKTTQYNYYKSRGGNLFIDHDVSALTGVGNGVMPIYPYGQTSGTPAFQVYLMDSGTYASSGYENPRTDQIDYYIQRSLTYPTVPSIWFQHIIVPDVFWETMTTTSNGTPGQSGNGSAFGSQTWYLQTNRINWAKSGQETTVANIFKELPCPPNESVYKDSAHRSSSSYGSKTLYEAWRDYGNMLGTYYGHDHKNSFVTTTQHGIDIGFGKAATLESYNDGNPGFRVFDLDVNGTYATHNVTEADLVKAQVFFDANGGTGELIPQFITKNSSAALRQNTYTKTGTTFLGWATSPTGNVVYANGANYTIGTSDVTLYAKWGVTSNITFNANGGTGGTGPTVMQVGTALTAPTVTRTGYTFAGWSPSVPSTVPETDTTYNAQWTANTYTINYLGNGSTSGSTASSTHTYNTAKNLTANGYSKVGHTFLGWSTSSSATTASYTNAQSVLNLTAAPNGIVTFYAVWQINSYTMTFDANGGSGGTSSLKTYGTALTAPTVTRTGHTFSGWLPSVPATVPANNETFVAQWTRNSYTITFNANGGNGGTSSSVLYGDLPSAPTVTRTGYTFAGWSPAVVAVTESTTYTAQWNANSYTITFDANGGSGGIGGTMTFGAPLAAPQVSRTGYTFDSWSPSVPTTVPAANTTYVAQWTPIEYLVTFDANGGIGGTSGFLPFDSELTPPAVVRLGYTFMGWSPELPSTVPAGDVTYTAQWLIEGNNVVFAPNGGSGGTGDMLTIGSPIVSPVMSRPGYIFSGWQPALPSTVVGGVNTYTAQWIKTQYLIIFDANGGSGTTSGLYEYGDHFTAPTVTKPGFTFTGWSPEIPSSAPAVNTVYTAQWARNQIQVTFDANGGVGGTSALMTFGDTLTPPTVTRPGYIFTGWSPAVPTKVVSGNPTYTAQWVAKN